MNIQIGPEGFDHGTFIGHMGQDPQFDLRIVTGIHEVALRGDKGFADPTRFLIADTDVLQVGIIRRKPSRLGRGLTVNGMDLMIGLDVFLESLGIGRIQFLIFTVFDQFHHDRVGIL